MLQKYINSKQKTQKQKMMCCVLIISQNILQLIMWKKKTGLKGVIKFFSVDFNPIDTSNILDIHKYLMEGT